ncbi:unnamed protein product [Arctia plantaginis]|uniref:Uncharacterized protein n=1 Tax=Arctia plantaginis TaxID=874455 RepID=A0A8S1A4J5_ARCPL|nr:unnamed protein product [Arctia plantaginis]
MFPSTEVEATPEPLKPLLTREILAWISDGWIMESELWQPILLAALYWFLPFFVLYLVYKWEVFILH